MMFYITANISGTSYQTGFELNYDPKFTKIMLPFLCDHVELLLAIIINFSIWAFLADMLIITYSI